MKGKFILSCESTIDMPYSYAEERELPVLFYSYLVDTTEYVDDMGRDPEALPKFYEMLASGVMPKTSQLNVMQYTEFFEGLLKEGDVLHIAMGSGMSQAVRNAFAAAEELKEKYPDRKILVVDSLCSSTGYGFLVDAAADMRDSGASIDEVYEWVENNKNRVHHQFFATQLDHYRRSGRMSGATATIATILNICPIMRIDNKGRIIAYSKVRGKKNAIKETIRVMEEQADGGKEYSGKCFVTSSNSPEDAQELKEAIRENFPNIDGEIRIYNIGTIIASHCGPGTCAAFFFGKERLPEE